MIESVGRIFQPDGELSTLPGYEFRPQQGEMARAVAAALQGRYHLIVEAPTGVGKSLAYLVPAILYAKGEQRKAVVSTHTRNLQEQLLKKDIPIARAVLHIPFDAVALKGRANYLCPTRLSHALRQQRNLFEKGDLEELQKINEWSEQTPDGDMENMPFIPSPSIWQQVCSERGTCSPTLCTPDCFFQKARRRAHRADLVIINHALLFTLLAMQEEGDALVFKDDFVVFDEAHTLEQAASNSVGGSLSMFQVLFAIHRFYNPKTKRGLFAGSRRKNLQTLCKEAVTATGIFFASIESAVRHASGGALRLTRKYAVDDTITPVLVELSSAVKQFIDEGKGGKEKEEIGAAARSIQETSDQIRSFLQQSDEGATYWVEMTSGRIPNVILRSAPTSIAASVGARLFREGATVVMTSGTLSVEGSLSYFQHRIGAENASTLILDSPYDLPRQMRITAVKNLPSPDQDGFARALPEAVLSAILRSRGRALVLFTNASLMKSVAVRLREDLDGEGITLLVQDGSVGRHRLLEEFRSDVGSVLFGLDSFWMGVDVPGEALEHVIITRLPFSVPDHPLVQSRLELIARSGGNAFADYTLPEAVLKFRQGVGRLIRSTGDKGVVTILDSRVLTKSYGATFLRSLPRCPIEIVTVDGEVVDEGNVDSML